MNPGHVSLLVRTEFRRRYRSVRSDTRRFAVLVIAGVFLLLPIGGVVIGLFVFGDRVAEGTLPFSLSMTAVRGGAAALLIGVAALNAIRTIQVGATPSNPDGVLLMADHSEVVASLLVVETILGAWIVIVPGVLGAIAFGIGAGSVLAGVAFLTAIVCVATLGSVLGIAVGFVVRNALARSETLSRYRTPAAVVLFLAYMYAIVATEFESAFDPVVSVLGPTPLGWYGDLALASLGVGASPLLVAGALVLALGGVAGLSVVVDRLARLLWYAEPVEGSTGETDSSGIGTVPGVPRPIARIVRKSWLRAYRSPIRLFFVVYPLFFLIAPISDAVRTGVVPSYLPAVVALYSAWATGSAFTLNPLGEEGDVLPIALTSPVSGRTFVAGYCLAGVLIGLPLSVLAVLVAAAFAGSSLTMAAGAVALAIILPVAAAGMAAGVGVTFPRFEPVNVTRGREAVVPSLIGFAVYSIALVVAATPGLAFQVSVARETVTSATNLVSESVLAVGVAATVVLAGVFAAVGYAHAVRTFDDYYME
jgi:hypothetical protein